MSNNSSTCSNYERWISPQINYKWKTQQCHPQLDFPEGWDIWHLENHWSNEDTMHCYIEKIIVPFIEKRIALKLPTTLQCLFCMIVFVVRLLLRSNHYYKRTTSNESLRVSRHGMLWKSKTTKNCFCGPSKGRHHCSSNQATLCQMDPNSMARFGAATTDCHQRFQKGRNF